jgi:hypothetical protein
MKSYMTYFISAHETPYGIHLGICKRLLSWYHEEGEAFLCHKDTGD